MDPCKVYANWDELDHLSSLDSLIQDALSEWGFDSVPVVKGASPTGGAPAEYKDGIIYLDLDNEEFKELFSDPYTAIFLAYHEMIHAMFEQAGWEFEPDVALDQFGGVEELFASDLGAKIADEALDGCMCEEHPVSSLPVDGDAPPFPWICDMD